MSGPQGYDPNTPWSGQQGGDPAWHQAPDQAPAYGQPYQQPSYGQPQYGGGDQPTAYGPSSYPQPQYGQPQQPQYGQQPGQFGDPQQPQYGQQPGQFGEPQQQFSPYGSTGGDVKTKKSTGLILGIVGGIVVLAVVIVLVLGFFVTNWFVKTNLDVNAAQSGVQKILSDETNGYGAKNVQDVTCNKGANPEVKKGGTFDCEVSIDGTKRQVTVTFQDDTGTYEVGRPR